MRLVGLFDADDRDLTGQSDEGPLEIATDIVLDELDQALAVLLLENVRDAPEIDLENDMTIKINIEIRKKKSSSVCNIFSH